jgi:heptosyltransferase-1
MKVAIVKLSAMGDIIHAMVALQYIKKANPSLEIDWIVEKGFVPILEGNPDITTILPVTLKSIKKDKKSLFSQIALVKAYAKNNYDLVIDAQGLFKSAMTAKLLAKNRAGFSKNSIREGIASYFYTHKVHIDYAANTIDRNAKVMSEPLGVAVSEQMIVDKKPFLFYKQSDKIDALLCTEQKNIIFVIGSTWESRNYPKEKFAQIADALKENVLIAWGSDEEKERAEWIEAHSKYAKALPKINLAELKEVIGKSDLLIGNDTGPTHMAWGMNVPSVTIFGPTPTNRVYVTPINKVIKSDSIVNHYKLNKSDFSIVDIDSKEIIVMAKALLDA